MLHHVQNAHHATRSWQLVGRSAVPHQGSHLAVHSRVFPSFIILIRPISRQSRSTLFAQNKNRKLQGHKVPTEHTEQKQAENTWDSQVQPQFFCHFVQNGVSIVVIYIYNEGVASTRQNPYCSPIDKGPPDKHFSVCRFGFVTGGSGVFLTKRHGGAPV